MRAVKSALIAVPLLVAILVGCDEARVKVATPQPEQPAKYMTPDEAKKSGKDYWSQFPEHKTVDCYDAKGNLIPDPFAKFGGVRESCGPNQIEKPHKSDPMGIRPGSSTQSCPGTNPNDPCNIR